jgi:hypothetical protein
MVEKPGDEASTRRNAREMSMSDHDVARLVDRCPETPGTAIKQQRSTLGLQ